jgi:hypothetical protein
VSAAVPVKFSTVGAGARETTPYWRWANPSEVQGSRVAKRRIGPEFPISHERFEPGERVGHEIDGVIGTGDAHLPMDFEVIRGTRRKVDIQDPVHDGHGGRQRRTIDQYGDPELTFGLDVEAAPGCCAWAERRKKSTPTSKEAMRKRR